MEVGQFHAADACFQNPIIIQKILKHTSEYSIEDLKLRLLNTSFNSEILHRIRKSHRSIEMRYRKSHRFWLCGNTDEPEEVKSITLNNRSIEADKIFDNLRFLKQVVNVKVDELVMGNFWEGYAKFLSCAKWRKRLHDEVHQLLEKQTLKKFIGMSDLCAGSCTKFSIRAGNSAEYGPLQIGITMDSFGNKRRFHFEKLIVGETHLHGTSSNIFTYVPAEGRTKFKLYMDPLISCDQLCFKISEFHSYPNERHRSRPLPLEVIEEMCDTWKPTSIGIEFDFWLQSANRGETWSDKGIFTPIRFDEPHQETDSEADKKKRKFSSVTIDMGNTRHIYRELVNGFSDENMSYSNLIANVRRVFPTDKIIIIGEWFNILQLRWRFNRERFEDILKSVWKNPGHLEVTIRHYVLFVSDEDDFEILNPIDIMGYRLRCTLLPEILPSPTTAAGRTFRITDQTSDKTLNLELFINIHWLKSVARKGKGYNGTPLENGYLRHF